MLVLYQLPVSHYCEKARWALDYKRLEYRINNLLVALHATQAKKLSSQTALPILVHDSKVVHESSHIISYLDHAFPQHPLTPADETLRQSALDWERYVDREIGIHVRLLYYHAVLDHPNVVIPFFTHNGPWYGPLLIRCIFPYLRREMRAYMNVTDEAALVSQERLGQAIDKVYSHIQNNGFLVGEAFTRADLATAALLAPLSRPQTHELRWPQPYPKALEMVIERYSAKISWVNELYEEYR